MLLAIRLFVRRSARCAKRLERGKGNLNGRHPSQRSTPIAYLPREEERRRNEQESGGAAPPEREYRNNDEKNLSGVTVANMQRRFLLLEQRLAVLEQREHERQIREKFGVAPAQFQSGAPLSDAAYFGDAGFAIGRQRDDHSKPKAHPEFIDTEDEKTEWIDDRKTRGLHAQLNESDSSRDESSRPQNDFIENRPSRSGEPAQAGFARRLAAAFSSFVVTAFLAGSIGFVVAILTVPAEKAAQFHTLVDIAVNAISAASHTK